MLTTEQTGPSSEPLQQWGRGSYRAYSALAFSSISPAAHCLMITFEFLETNSRVEKGFPEVRYKVSSQAPVFLLGAVTPDLTVTEAFWASVFSWENSGGWDSRSERLKVRDERRRAWGVKLRSVFTICKYVPFRGMGCRLLCCTRGKFLQDLFLQGPVWQEML